LINLSHEETIIYIVAPERGHTQKNFLDRIAETSKFEVKVNPCYKFTDIVNARMASECEADRVPKLIEIKRVVN
jgi:hypothetical protein